MGRGVPRPTEVPDEECGHIFLPLAGTDGEEICRYCQARRFPLIRCGCGAKPLIVLFNPLYGGRDHDWVCAFCRAHYPDLIAASEGRVSDQEWE